jgi:Phosphotransferase enzyme family
MLIFSRTPSRTHSETRVLDGVPRINSLGTCQNVGVNVTPDEWPLKLRAYLNGLNDALLEVTEIQKGISGRRVHRVRLKSGWTLIVKENVSVRESGFYRDFASALRVAGVVTPRLEHQISVGGSATLVLQNVPQTLPKERWLADQAVIGTLRGLHAFAPAREPQDAFRPAWTPEMNAAALAFLPSNLVEKLETLRLEAQALFEPRHLISGDPNPNNWGVLNDGTPALFDWDRFGLGTAALDLTITVPGLGSPKDFALVAALYAGRADAALARSVALAKLWSLLEFSEAMNNHPQARPHLEFLAGALPDWLKNTVTDA